MTPIPGARLSFLSLFAVLAIPAYGDTLPDLPVCKLSGDLYVSFSQTLHTNNPQPLADFHVGAPGDTMDIAAPYTPGNINCQPPGLSGRVYASTGIGFPTAPYPNTTQQAQGMVSGAELYFPANTGETKVVTLQLSSPDGGSATAIFQQDAGGVFFDLVNYFYPPLAISWTYYDGDGGTTSDSNGRANPAEIWGNLGLRARVIHQPEGYAPQISLQGNGFTWYARTVYPQTCLACPTWLTVEGDQMGTGTFDPTLGRATIHIGFNKAGLTPGVYKAQVNVQLNDPGVIQVDYFRAKAIKVIPVTLIVLPRGSTLPLTVVSSDLPVGTGTVSYRQALTAAGGDGNYSWSLNGGSLPSGLSLTSDGLISGTPDNIGGVYTFTVQVADGSGGAANQDLSISLYSLPTVTTTTLASGSAGQDYESLLSAIDGTGTYTWSLDSGGLPPGVSLTSDGLLTGTPGAAGSYSFTVRATDTNGSWSTQTLSLNIQPKGGPLAVSTQALADGAVNQPYRQLLTATGGSGNYTWSSSGSLPTGISLDPTGLISGTPAAAGSVSFAVSVSDASQPTFAAVSQPLTLNIEPGNAGATIGGAPGSLAILTSALPPVVLQQQYNQTLIATGGTGPYTWSVLSGSLPDGITLSQDGVLSGAPGTAGRYSFSLAVTDSNGNSASTSLSISVGGGAVSITIGPAALPAGTSNQAYSTTLTASGGTPPYTWSVAPGGALPTGFTLSGVGVLAGNSNVPGTFPFTVKVVDGNNVSATQSFSLVINAAPLAISTTSLPAGVTGQSYTQALSATGGVPPYSWSVSGGALPAGITLSSAGQLSGKATASGTFSFTAKVTDSKNTSATQTLSLVIGAPPLTITTTSLPSGEVGQSYSQTLGATGGTPPYTWSINNGTWPGALVLSDSGVLSGILKTAGSFTFVLRVSDAAGKSATQSYTLVVGASDLAITTTSLPNAQVGVPYNAPLSATGGSPPYAWTVGSALFPSTGLSVNFGSISGTPAIAGTFSLLLNVTDSANVTVSRTFTLTIAAAPLAITTSSLPSGKVGQGYSATLTAMGGVPPYTWSSGSGVLPNALPPNTGLTLSPAGLISGTAILSGSFTVQFNVTDAAHTTTNRTLTLVIATGISPR